jgi:DNA (cytosine-5)-methyltransferase 1
MRVLDLFSGIGGFSLGLERAGMTTAAFCEIDPKARLVLQKHWPKVPVYENVETLTADRLAADGISVDVICGGFPCQDISLAGKGAGLAGDRSGLWFQFHRLIEEIRPSWVIIENVSALRSRGLEQVLGGLAALRYDAEWHCIPASAVGAPHQRDRIWIVAYPTGAGRETWGGDGMGIEHQSRGDEGQSQGACSQAGARICRTSLAHSSCELPHGRGPSTEQTGRDEPTDGSAEVADASSAGLPWREWIRDYLAETQGRGQTALGSASECGPVGGRKSHSWLVEPDVGRVADGVPKRVDRLKQLGNAVVPQIPEMIGRAIMAAPT